MPRFEYHIEPMADNSTPNAIMLDRLNELGKERWRLVPIVLPGPLHLLFERESENHDA